MALRCLILSDPISDLLNGGLQSCRIPPSYRRHVPPSAGRTSSPSGPPTEPPPFPWSALWRGQPPPLSLTLDPKPKNCPMLPRIPANRIKRTGAASRQTRQEIPTPPRDSCLESTNSSCATFTFTGRPHHSISMGGRLPQGGGATSLPFQDGNAHRPFPCRLPFAPRSRFQSGRTPFWALPRTLSVEPFGPTNQHPLRQKHPSFRGQLPNHFNPCRRPLDGSTSTRHRTSPRPPGMVPRETFGAIRRQGPLTRRGSVTPPRARNGLDDSAQPSGGQRHLRTFTNR